VTTWFRVFFIGGGISFRALFAWIRPWVYIPTLIVGPTSQILFFAFLGRTAHLEDDSWFVVGNAVQSASLAALFGMGFAIDGERWMQTLSAVLGTPANRSALFLGRALPVLLNASVSASARSARSTSPCALASSSSSESSHIRCRYAALA